MQRLFCGRTLAFMGQRITSSYCAPWWLKSPHLQTMLPTFMRKRPQLDFIWERLELKDGDFIDLAWYPRLQAPLVLMMHGLEGSLNSHYASTLVQALSQAGFSVVFMLLRGRGLEPNRLAKSYHSGASADLAEVLAQLKARGQMPAAAVGVSLSANLLLKYLGETGIRSGLKAAVAISTPFQLAVCAKKLEQGFARVYGQYLLKQLKDSYRTKFQRLAEPKPLNLDTLTTIYQFDDQVTAPVNGFLNAADYYQRSSSAQFLGKIQTPTLIIHALDDPFMRPSIVPSAAQTSASVHLEFTEHGGHVGFISGTVPWKLHYWLDERVPAWLRSQLLEAV
ncbi:hydrolase [uncultured Thiothrix sp.]|uniref:hydrolase n=1 Tax=uncultured Thiothrix sp. TaxID=223185 RepID=UPI002608D147|nr:hydrolase [uncultured Thiothrix sp.]HMT93452.1 hydrolase [Thiolinea sp.]